MKNMILDPAGVEVYTIWDTANDKGECSFRYEADTAEDLKAYFDYWQEFDGTGWTYQNPIEIFRWRIFENRTDRHIEVIDSDVWRPDFERERSDYKEHNTLHKSAQGV